MGIHKANFRELDFKDVHQHTVFTVCCGCCNVQVIATDKNTTTARRNFTFKTVGWKVLSERRGLTIQERTRCPLCMTQERI